MSPKPTLGVTLRCQRRPRHLRLALQAILEYRRHANVKLHILADRPTFEVEQVLQEFKDEFWGLKYLPFPILSRQGERFREAKQFQFELIEPAAPDWILLADDDRWFEPLGIDVELPAALSQDDFDIFYATSWFVWDRSDQFNAARHHHSPVLFRYEPGLHYPLDRDIQVPLPLHDEAIVQGRAAAFSTPLLDYGTFSESDRRETYNAFIEAGKNDAYVESIQSPPDLRSIDKELMRPWKDLWKESNSPTPNSPQSPSA